MKEKKLQQSIRMGIYGKSNKSSKAKKKKKEEIRYNLYTGQLVHPDWHTI